jgi:hypothetical protein
MILHITKYQNSNTLSSFNVETCIPFKKNLSMNIKLQNWLPLIFVKHLKQNLIVFGGHLICINIPIKKWILHLLYDK